MGTVYQAEHVLIKRRVAVKVLHSEYTTDPDVIERFMNEARAAGTLGHPNIVESTDMGFARDTMPYIVFEYLDGSPLSDEVYRLQGLTVRRALRIAHQIASALEAAHTAGIVHRDLKSDNVFLTHREEVSDHVKVIDFGISRFTEAETTTGGGGRRRGQVMGTPEFMAPEQMTSPDSVDHRVDIYALGVVLYEMLASRTPWVNNGDTDALVHQILLEVPPPINRKEIPPGLNELIFERLLNKDPAKRFQTMKEVKGALEAFWGASRRDSQPIEPIELPAAAAAAAPAQAPAEAIGLQPPPPRRRRPSIIPLVLAVLCAGAGVYLKLQAGKLTPKPDAAAMAALDADAASIAGAIDTVANEVRLRAQSVATTPVLRAAIETDAATIQDLVKDGALTRPGAGDVMEVVQVRGGAKTPLVRVPAEAPPLADPGTDGSVDAANGQVRVIAGAPVTSNTNVEAGAIWISAPVELRDIGGKLKEHTVGARIDGFKAPIVLVPPTGAAGEQVSRPIAPRSLKGAKIALTATIARVMPPDTYTLPANGCFGAAGLLLLIFVVGLLLHKKRARGHS